MTQPRNPSKPKVVNRKDTFDLDALEKDADAPKPKPVRLGGEEFIFADLQDADWQTLRDIRDGEDVDEQLRTMLGGQYEGFAEKPLPGWKLTALMRELDEHFGWSARMGGQGEDAASSTS